MKTYFMAKHVSSHVLIVNVIIISYLFYIVVLLSLSSLSSASLLLSQSSSPSSSPTFFQDYCKYFPDCNCRSCHFVEISSLHIPYSISEHCHKNTQKRKGYFNVILNVFHESKQTRFYEYIYLKILS